ncbi:MAG: hypothetical protein FJX18_05500 [Alphaproteobacteria bacterium]|nr:hypothetical protein [Alphaproteobacteria bacterium]
MKSPLYLISHSTVSARIWCAIAFAMALVCAFLPQLTIHAMKEKEKVVILSPDGSVLYSPALGFSEQGSLQAYEAKLAALCILQRNPNGQDLPEIGKVEFIKPAKDKIEKLIESQAAEFKEKNIHQKCEITKIVVLDTKKITDRKNNSLEAYTVKVNGNLIRDGSLHNILFHEPYSFEMELIFLRNPNILSNGMLPLALYDIRYTEKEIK